MSSIAASGGYYIAIGADYILANPGSVTGSIGVIMNYPIAKNLLDKIGIKYETYKSGLLKDSGSPFRNSSKEDSVYFSSIVEDLHNQFISEVSIQRQLPLETVRKYSTGEIFTGKMAFENNLIDSLGTFEDALNLAKKMTNITGVINIIYDKKNKINFFDLFLSKNNYNNFINKFNFKIPMYLIY